MHFISDNVVCSEIHLPDTHKLLFMITVHIVYFTAFTIAILCLFVYIFNLHLRLCSLIIERGGRETLQCERKIGGLPPVFTPTDWGLNPQPRYVP